MNLLRKETIGKYIQEKGAVTVKELGALFPEVSLMTIHRDLEKLEREGVITRTRGGAIAVTQGSSPTEAKLEARSLKKVIMQETGLLRYIRSSPV